MVRLSTCGRVEVESKCKNVDGWDLCFQGELGGKSTKSRDVEGLTLPLEPK